MKKIYHLFNPVTFFVTGACFFNEGTQPTNAIYQENVNFIKPKFDPVLNLIVEGASASEILQVQAAQLDALDEAYVYQLEESGLAIVRRHRKRLRRRVEENTTTFEDAKQVRKLLRSIWQELKDGDFDWALTDAQAINQTTLNNSVKREVNWLIDRINEQLIANPL